MLKGNILILSKIADSLAEKPKNGGSPPRDKIIKINIFLLISDIFVLLISVILIKFNL
jgi:hypothetical protein